MKMLKSVVLVFVICSTNVLFRTFSIRKFYIGHPVVVTLIWLLSVIVYIVLEAHNHE